MHLFGVRPVQLLDSFDFDHKAVFDDQISFESPFKAHPIEFDIDRHLPIDFETGPKQRAFQNGFINASSRPGPSSR